jgi:phytoene/squalene synthetase
MDTHEFIGIGAVQSRPDPSKASPSSADEAALASCAVDAGDSFGWAMRLLPSPRRQGMQALCAFRRELAEIARRTGSRTLKLALLADCRTEIARLYTGRPLHLITRSLRVAVDRYDLRCDDFLAIIAGVEMDVRSDLRAPTLEEFDLYCERSAAAVCRSALHILGATPAAAGPLASALGRGMRLTGILRDLTRDAARQRLYLPREILRAHGIIGTMPAYVLAQPMLPPVCDAIADLATADFRGAENALRPLAPCARLAARAMLASHRALLSALLARGWSRLDEPVRIPAWCRSASRIGNALIGTE